MLTRITTALAAVALLLGLAYAPAALGASTPDDCTRVAAADRTLCQKVKLQHPYGRTYDGKRQNAWSNPSGKTIVHTITHSGYTKHQMHEQLVSEASDYTLNVTAVPVNMDNIAWQCGNTDGQVVLSFVDADGKPGGTKLTYLHFVCA